MTSEIHLPLLPKLGLKLYIITALPTNIPWLPANPRTKSKAGRLSDLDNHLHQLLHLLKLGPSKMSVVRRSEAAEADLEEMSAPSLHLQWSLLDMPALSEPCAWPAASYTLHIAHGFCHRTNTRAGWQTETSSLRPTWFQGLLYQQ